MAIKSAMKNSALIAGFLGGPVIRTPAFGRAKETDHMAGQAALESIRKQRAFGRLVRARALMRAAFFFVFVAAVLAWPGRALADPVTSAATLTQENGYALLLLRFAEEMPTEVTMSVSSMAIRFAKPVDMSVDALNDAGPGFVVTAWRDPDFAEIRLA